MSGVVLMMHGGLSLKLEPHAVNRGSTTTAAPHEANSLSEAPFADLSVFELFPERPAAEPETVISEAPAGFFAQLGIDLSQAVITTRPEIRLVDDGAEEARRDVASVSVESEISEARRIAEEYRLAEAAAEEARLQAQRTRDAALLVEEAVDALLEELPEEEAPIFSLEKKREQLSLSLAS
ncbi:hypothetical protein MRY87_12060 [bacterium]|nr:hypothetical protein [bacterium]